MKKKPITKKRKTKKKRQRGSEDDRQRRKFDKGGRIEAYTWGEAQKSDKWP